MTDTYLLDTNAVRYLFDDTPDGDANEATLRFRARLREVDDSRLLICAVTLGEVEYGLRLAEISEVGNMSHDLQKKVRDALARFRSVIPLNENTACPYYAHARARVFHRYAPRLKKQKKREKVFIDELTDPTSGKELTIQENDLWIACIALQHNFVLVSDDRHMQHIRDVCTDLRLENWLVG